jgi:hypothetical protein
MQTARSARLAPWLAEVERACENGRPAPLTIVSLLRGAPAGAHGRISEVARLSGYSWGTVSSLAWLAARIPADVQRPDLSLAHHRAVAGLTHPEQRRRLSEAKMQRLSASALRRLIAAEASS